MTYESLEQAIIDDPDDENAFLVLADAIGGTQGELVVLQHQLATRHTPDLVAREQVLRGAVEAELARHGKVALEWYLGFVRKLQIDRSSEVRAILEHPSVRFATQVALEMEWAAGDEVIAILAERSRPSIRYLSLYEHDGDPFVDTDEATSRLWPMLPRLETAYLRSERAMFHEMTHPRITALECKIAPFGEQGWQWDLPALERLEWDPHIESECEITVLDTLWEQKLPALRRLVIDGELFNPETPLFDRGDVRRFMRQLTELEMPIRAIADRDEVVAHLLANADHLEHLSALHLSGVFREDRFDDMTALRARLPKLALLT